MGQVGLHIHYWDTGGLAAPGGPRNEAGDPLDWTGRLSITGHIRTMGNYKTPFRSVGGFWSTWRKPVQSQGGDVNSTQPRVGTKLLWCWKCEG